MKFSQNGWDFDDEIFPLSSANQYCNEKKVKAHVFLASRASGEKAFVIFNDKGSPVYEDTSYEGILVHIDIMALAKEIK